MLLSLYGIIPTLQDANFDRVYAAYGGIFVVMSVLWGYGIDGVKPDIWDISGAMIVLSGVGSTVVKSLKCYFQYFYLRK